MKNSFFLVIPRQQNEPQRLKEFEAKSLQQWLDDLPTANLSLATRLIHDFIVELNTLKMPSQLRLDVLERSRSNFHLIENYLQARLTKTGFPKDDNEKKIFDILIVIEKEYAIGYWAVLKELTHRDAGWFKGRNTALTIQRCIKCLGNIIASHFIMRMPVPDWIWIDVHSLYKLSVKLDNHTTKVTNPLKPSAKTQTPEASYYQVLLLSLVEPTGLTQKDIPLIDDFTESIATLVSLKKTPVTGQRTQCVIRNDEDKPPYFQTDLNDGDTTAHYLDLTKLYNLLNHHNKIENKPLTGFFNVMLSSALPDPITKLSSELLAYLQHRWFGIELQGDALFSDRLDRYITIGLPSLNLPETGDEKEELLVQSASDRLLSAVFKKTGVLSVGSLVSIRKKNEPENSRSLGIVNKLSVVNQNGKIAFGIRLITDRFYTVNYTIKQTTGNDMQQVGMFYSARDHQSEKKYVITDYFMFEDGDVITLSMEHEAFPVTLRNRKNIGLGYWRFECQRIVEVTKIEQSKKGYDFI